MFTINKVRNIIHRTRTVKGIHRNQILKSARFQFPQIFLHTGRFELECTNRPSFTIKSISRRIRNVNLINIQDNPLTMLDIFNRLFDNRKGLQTQKVHLDQSSIFNNWTFILGHQHFFTGFLIICRTYRHPVRYIISTYNSTARMHTCITDIPLQHLCILYRITQNRIGWDFRCL